MIPTINVEGVDKDFNPMDKNTYKGFNNDVNSNYEIMSASDSNIKTAARNHGHLYPPGNIVGLGFQ